MVAFDLICRVARSHRLSLHCIGNPRHSESSEISDTWQLNFLLEFEKRPECCDRQDDKFAFLRDIDRRSGHHVNDVYPLVRRPCLHHVNSAQLPFH